MMTKLARLPSIDDAAIYGEERPSMIDWDVCCMTSLSSCCGVADRLVLSGREREHSIPQCSFIHREKLMFASYGTLRPVLPADENHFSLFFFFFLSRRM